MASYGGVRWGGGAQGWGELSSAPGIMSRRYSSRLISGHVFRVTHRAGILLGSCQDQGLGQ